MNFAQATHFVRWKLDHCTDKQLSGAGLTTRERDSYLARNVLLSAEDLAPSYTALFWPKRSLEYNATFIQYTPERNHVDTMDAAAHEAFHAAKLWGSPAWQRGLKTLDATLIGHLGILTMMGGVANMAYAQTSQNAVHCVTAATMLAGGALMTFGGFHLLPNSPKDLYREEMGAHRFGYLFNPDLYVQNHQFPSDEDLLHDPHYKMWIDNGYPPGRERYDLLLRTKRECLEKSRDDLLFPDGLSDLWNEFGQAQKSFDRSDIEVYVAPTRPKKSGLIL